MSNGDAFIVGINGILPNPHSDGISDNIRHKINTGCGYYIGHCIFPNCVEKKEDEKMRGLILYEPKGKALETARFVADQEDKIFVCNPFNGCYHGCWYCYNPKIMKKSKDEFKNISIKGEDEQHVINKVKYDLRNFGEDIEWVYLSFSTDPFQNIDESEYEDISLGIIEALKEEDIGVITLTKGAIGDYVDIDNYPDWYGITLVSLSENFREKYEIDSLSFEKRIKALKKAHNMGIKTWVSIEPYPTPKLFKQQFRPVLEAVDFVDKMIFGKWNYDYRASGRFNNAFYIKKKEEFIEFCEERGIQYKVKEDVMKLRGD